MKVGYLGSKNMFYGKEQTKQGWFSPALREERQRCFSYPLGVWEKLQGAISRRLQGQEQLQDQAAQGRAGAFLQFDQAVSSAC